MGGRLDEVFSMVSYKSRRAEGAKIETDLFYMHEERGSSPQNHKYIFFLLHLVLFISLNCFGVSCLVLEISAVEISAFSQIQWD